MLLFLLLLPLLLLSQLLLLLLFLLLLFLLLIPLLLLLLLLAAALRAALQQLSRQPLRLLRHLHATAAACLEANEGGQQTAGNQRLRQRLRLL